MRLKNRIFFALFISSCSFAFAQQLRENVTKFPERISQYQSAKQNLRTEATALTLPFWEDFSDTSTIKNRFQPNTGIYFNNNLCINAPSVNVATFDGVDAKGNTYFTSNIYQIGEADSLVSLDIDLDSVSKSDSLFFSFQYQIAGYGEIPDANEGDSLELQFFTKGGKWKTVWQSSYTIAKDSSVFYPVLLKIEDSVFFHSNFKFKFFNYARLSGMFDLWHVDYIVMDTVKVTSNLRGIQDGKMFFSDQAISKSPTSIIAGRYISVPAKHLSSLQFKSDFEYSISNLSSKSNTVFSFFNFARKSGSDYVSEPKSSSLTGGINQGITPVKQTITSSSLSPISEEFELINKVFLDIAVPNSGNYLFESNDTVTSVFPFKDYYAYDDGTYEYGVKLDQVNAKQAVAFEMLQPDTITHIDISLPYIGYNISSSVMYLKIWADNDNKPGKEIFSQKATPIYSSGVNPFTRYALNKTVVLNGKYYIGFQQASGNTKAIRVGFDANNINKDKFWFDNNQGTGWSQYRNLDGTVMIRPVFQDHALNIAPVVNAKTEILIDLDFYPNPTNDGLITLNAVFDQILVSDTKGRILASFENTNQINISGLEPNLYFIKASLEGHHSYKRLIYQK